MMRNWLERLKSFILLFQFNALKYKSKHLYGKHVYIYADKLKYVDINMHSLMSTEKIRITD